MSYPPKFENIECIALGPRDSFQEQSTIINHQSILGGISSHDAKFSFYVGVSN